MLACSRFEPSLLLFLPPSCRPVSPRSQLRRSCVKTMLNLIVIIFVMIIVVIIVMIIVVIIVSISIITIVLIIINMVLAMSKWLSL